MIKDIKYTGYTTTPSDYECADGQLSTAINVVQEDGALRPIHKPAKMLLLDPTYKLLLIHSTSSGDKNYILCDKETRTKLYWLATSDKTSDPTLIATLDSALTDLAIIGNTISLSIVNGSESHMEYILWTGTSYDYLGKQPNNISIKFALTDLPMADKDVEKVSNITMDTTDLQNWSVATDKFEMTTSLQTSVSNAIWGHLLDFVAEQCTEKNRFYQPFFIRYAFRLYDGSYIKHSAPILMIPCSGVPPVISTWAEYSKGVLTFKSNFKYMPVCKLWFKTAGIDATKLTQWKDVITHVAIFISAPIYTFNEAKNFDKNANYLRNAGYSGFTHSAPSDDITQDNVERVIQGDPSSAPKFWNYPAYSDEDYRDKLTANSSFYKVKELEIEDVISGKWSDDFQELEMPESIQSSLTTRETLPDDYQTNNNVAGNSLYAFNSRLNMSNIVMTLFEGYKLDRMAQYTYYSGAPGAMIALTTSVKKNAKEYEVQTSNSGDANPFLEYFPRYLYYPDAGASKIVIDFVGATTKRMTIPLKAHPTLNGAYYFRGMEVDAEAPTIEEVTAKMDVTAEPVLYPNKVYTSEADNPFDFLATGINTVGTGSIIGIRAAVRALSQGQFGQHPLYAFSTDGIWALAVTDTGTYSTKQPVTRDVCIDEKSITQIDSSVLFATARGIMEISGSTSVCLSDDIDNINTTQSDTDLPSMGVLTTLASIDSVDLEMIKFRKYIQDCGMIYDYINQRIIVYNPTQTYAYVYSIKSKTWSTMHSDIDYHINSYPDAIAVSREISYLITQNRGIHDLNADDNAEKYEVNADTTTETPGATETTTPLVKIMDLSASETSIMGAGMIVTRPIKLASNNLKSLRALVQRGMFVSEHVNQILYASNDLFNWFAVASSTDGMIQALGGTPYKYYKLAVVTKLLNGESLDGFSVDSLERFTNKLR
jgi:hypothetical protein